MIALRYTNARVRRLHEESGIDLLNLTGDAMTDRAKRSAITLAGAIEDADTVRAAIEEMTPGEHIEMLTEAIRRDLVPASIREAMAKAESANKSA